LEGEQEIKIGQKELHHLDQHKELGQEATSKKHRPLQSIYQTGFSRPSENDPKEVEELFELLETPYERTTNQLSQKS
jgi:hypothetical protein